MTRLRLRTGKGAYDANPPEEEPRMRECPDCGGTGEITVYWTVSSSNATANGIKGGIGSMSATGECPSCNGTGEVPREEPEDAQFDTEAERDGAR